MNRDERRVVFGLTSFVAAMSLLGYVTVEWFRIEPVVWDDIIFGVLLMPAAATPIAMMLNTAGRDVIRQYLPGSYFSAMAFTVVCAAVGFAFIVWGREALRRAIGI